jgi:hypothetical protein
VPPVQRLLKGRPAAPGAKPPERRAHDVVDNVFLASVIGPLSAWGWWVVLRHNGPCTPASTRGCLEGWPNDPMTTEARRGSGSAAAVFGSARARRGWAAGERGGRRAGGGAVACALAPSPCHTHACTHTTHNTAQHNTHTHTRTHARTRTHTHTHTHANIHAHNTHAPSLSPLPRPQFRWWWLSVAGLYTGEMVGTALGGIGFKLNMELVAHHVVTMVLMVRSAAFFEIV